MLVLHSPFLYMLYYLDISSATSLSPLMSRAGEPSSTNMRNILLSKSIVWFIKLLK